MRTKEKKDNPIQNKETKSNPRNFTLSLAIVDMIPVVCFTAAMLIFAFYVKVPLLILGTVICSFAGICKVLWKFLIVLANRDIQILTKPMRIFMPLGFALILISLFIFRNNDRLTDSFRMLKDSPCRFFFLLWILGLIVMGILGAKLDKDNVKHNWIEQIVNTVAQAAFLLGVIILCYISSFYHADSVAVNAMLNPPAKITITEDSNLMVFDPVSECDTAFIFYPGAKVASEAYVPLMEKISSGGVKCILVKMPDNLAILGKNQAERIPSLFPEIKHWYIGGHSLGGAMAAAFLEKHAASYDGLILLASYSTADLSNLSLSVLSVYGSADEVLNRDKYCETLANYPNSFEEVVVHGGNHANFGDYGDQKGDGIALLSREDQQDITAKAIIEFVTGS